MGGGLESQLRSGRLFFGESQAGVVLLSFELVFVLLLQITTRGGGYSKLRWVQAPSCFSFYFCFVPQGPLPTPRGGGCYWLPLHPGLIPQAWLAASSPPIRVRLEPPRGSDRSAPPADDHSPPAMTADSRWPFQCILRFRLQIADEQSVVGSNTYQIYSCRSAKSEPLPWFCVDNGFIVHFFSVAFYWIYSWYVCFIHCVDNLAVLQSVSNPAYFVFSTPWHINLPLNGYDMTWCRVIWMNLIMSINLQNYACVNKDAWLHVCQCLNDIFYIKRA